MGPKKKRKVGRPKAPKRINKSVPWTEEQVEAIQGVIARRWPDGRVTFAEYVREMTLAGDKETAKLGRAAGYQGIAERRA